MRPSALYTGRILLEKNADKRASEGFVVFLDHSTEEYWLETMESTNKQASTPVRSWSDRAGITHPPKVDYYAELNAWVQHAIVEAEKNKTSTRKISS
jgi:hypothetical protein